jgi:phosphoglycolate phosphatase
MNKILLFDFDGTIADSFENFLAIVDILSVKHNLMKLPREELEKLRGEEPRTLMKRLKIPFYKIPFLGRDMKVLQKQKITKIKPFHDLPEVLLAIKNLGYTMGILTSNAKENVELFLKNNNIEIFSYIYSDSSMFGKAGVINKFLKQNAVPKGNVFYIGDEIRDIEACKKAGIKIIAVTWGFNTKEGLRKNHPDYLIDTPNDLLSLLQDKVT